MRDRIDELNELLREVDDELHRELFEEESICRSGVELLIAKKVKLEIELHDLLKNR